MQTEPTHFCLDSVLNEIITGLSETPKTIPSKYFYDERGSALFEEITRLEAYYPTRTELGIMASNIHEIVQAVGENAVLIEYGSGSSEKTRLLLDALPNLTAYVPIDISAEHLKATVKALQDAYPALHITPIAADYTKPYTIPDDPVARRKRVVYFPGSTIGNFTPKQAEIFLRQISDVIGDGGGFLLGVDRKKDKAILERAYNDPEGVTAAFNLNIMERLNRELDADFDVTGFRHLAFYNEELGRIEMHLVSTRDQSVRIGHHMFSFTDGESIHTENSYKFDIEDVAEMASTANLELTHTWSDENEWFSILYFACANEQQTSTPVA